MSRKTHVLVGTRQGIYPIHRHWLDTDAQIVTRVIGNYAIKELDKGARSAVSNRAYHRRRLLEPRAA